MKAIETIESRTVADLLTHNWWLLALRGLVAVAFGVLAFVWPKATVLFLVYLFSAYAVIGGLFALFVAAKAPKGYPRFGSLIFEGILSVCAGVIAFLMPGITALAMLFLIACWAIITGISEIISAVRLRKFITNEWMLIFAGIASIAFGVLLLLVPHVGALALIWWIGSFAFISGLLFIGFAFSIKRWSRRIGSSGPLPA